MSTASSLPHGLHFVSSTPVPGLAVAERRVANPEATLICIHGGLDRGGAFARLARRCERFDVVTYDRRGYQGSRRAAPRLRGREPALTKRSGGRGAGTMPYSFSELTLGLNELNLRDCGTRPLGWRS